MHGAYDDQQMALASAVLDDVRYLIFNAEPDARWMTATARQTLRLIDRGVTGHGELLTRVYRWLLWSGAALEPLPLAPLATPASGKPQGGRKLAEAAYHRKRNFGPVGAT